MNWVDVFTFVFSAGASILLVLSYLKYEYKNDSERKKSRVMTFTSDDRNCRKCCFRKIQCNQNCAYGKLSEIISFIKNAEMSVDVCVLLITNVQLYEALLEVHKRGIKVRVVVDGEMSRNKYSLANNLQKAGILVLVNETNATMHHKFCIIDSTTEGAILMTGSANWTLQAFTGNFEYICIIKDEYCVKMFLDEFEKLCKFCSDKSRNMSQSAMLDLITNVQ